MELRHLRYFVAVAEELHFGRAAARLHIAQPPLSQQIRQLERELGFELFLRTNRRVRLTEAGGTFLLDARGILERVSRAAESARRVARGEVGSLAVGFVASATYALLPRLVRTFRQRHPEIALTLTELSTAEQVAAIRAGSIQLGLARPPVGDETLREDPLAEEPLVVALAARHPLAARRALSLRALAEEPFVLFPRQPRPGWADEVVNACRAAGFRPEVAQETLELSTTVALVAAGIGITLVPESAQTVRLPGVVYRPLRSPAPRTRLVAIHRPEDPRPVVQRFLAVAHEVIGAGAGGSG
ncbi:LysR family transcriptional regulator [Anaeromyxobacter sp. SG17]|uniref:LysR family transcriptional regulator n=1 Tax=Anaeromyxobacter sp. SG17 TaxID=2925405 RepID=UPI001F57FF6A|nr:LysR family transcriptional regulator [Anaeromyxobacter sp. SG17]